MAESQPGQVQSFDPSITLSNFSAENRDRFMFNENQLVLAKLQQPRPVEASAVNRADDNTLTVFDEYRNLDEEFVYFDGSFQSLSTPGVPTLPVHQIVIGFDRQITTGTIKFWSTGFVDTDLIFVEWSFDNVTWFAAGDITWVQEFDDTIEVFPGDNPPTGEFVYTGTIDSGAITARYWRIRGDAEEVVTNFSSGNITVADTSHFPDSGGLILLDSAGDFQSNLTYTSKTSTQLQGISGGSPSTTDIVISNDTPFASGVTEVQIIPTLSPTLEHWNSDGSKAVTNVIEGADYYDMAYDSNDDVYYAMRFSTGLELSSSLDPDDNFDDISTGSNFDSSKWRESATNPYFIHNTSSGTLDMSSAGGPGQLEGNYGLDGRAIVTLELVGAFQLAEDAYFALEGKNFSSGNEYIVSAIKGPYTPGTNTSGTFVAASLEYNNTVGGAAELQNFRLKPEAFDFSYPGGNVVYELTYDSGTGKYNVTASGISHPDASPGVPYTLMDSAAFTISNVTTPADGQKFTITARVGSAPIAGTSVSGIGLQIERFGTNSYARYEDTDAPGFNTLHTGNIPSGVRIRPQIYGDPNGSDVNILADNYTVTGGGTVFFNTPVFSIVTINKQGSQVQVAGVSDSDGYAIKSFDVIRDPQATYNEFLTPRVGIATNGADVGSGGEIYIKVNDTLYKYTKSSLPLVNETGTSASATSTGEIPETAIANFAYNGYSGGGLSYIEFLSDLGGVFLKSIENVGLTEEAEKAFLDVDSINLPFAWNVSDLATLYFVDAGSALKLYDLNETKAAFVNVTSDKQVLAAGTQETANVTAQVLNVYGEPKSNKSMTFSVTAGDGAISPAVGCSDGNGEDSTTYTVGSSVGTATITVTVSDLSC